MIRRLAVLAVILSALAIPALAADDTLFDSGTPKKISGEYFTIPVWWVLDVFDNRNGVIVAPVNFEKPVRVTAISVFVQTSLTVDAGNFEIWKLDGKYAKLTPGQQVQNIGEKISTQRWSMGSQAISKEQSRWVTMKLKEPMELPAGTYGVAFGADMEFATNWVLNAPNGNGWFYWSWDEEKNFTFRSGDEGHGAKLNAGIRVYGSEQ